MFKSSYYTFIIALSSLLVTFISPPTILADAPNLEPIITFNSTVAPMQSATTYTGTIEGAAYRIRVPANWDKETLLVYAHGYRDKADQAGQVDDKSAEAAPGGTSGEDLLLANGYAIAGSAFRNNGWAVQEGISDTLALTQFFSQTIAPPKRVILVGASLGSVVVLKSIEIHPETYHGAIALCGVGAGASKSWDAALAFALAYDVTFGWPSSWGTVNDVRDNVFFQQDVAPILLAQGFNPANKGKFEFIRLLGQFPSEGFLSAVDGANGTPWLGINMVIATEWRAELERRAGGAISQNADHVYTLSAADKSYLAGLGVDANDLLAKMNTRTNITTTETARAYLHDYADFTGKITRPILTMHTTKDGFVSASNETVYRDLVAQAGKTDLLVQTYVDSLGHCTFTADQAMATVKAMDSWLKTGNRPTTQAFTATGFLPNYVSPAWPIGFKGTGYQVYLPVIMR